MIDKLGKYLLLMFLVLTFPLPTKAELSKTVQIDKKQALILKALNEYSDIDCKSVIMHSNELEQLAGKLPVSLYYYRGDCLNKEQRYQAALSDIELYFLEVTKKSTIYQKALILHAKIEKNLELQKMEEMHLAAVERDKQAALREKALHMKLLIRLVEASKNLYVEICRLKFASLISKRNNGDRETKYLRTQRCKEWAKRGKFGIYDLNWVRRLKYDSRNRPYEDVRTRFTVANIGIADIKYIRLSQSGLKTCFVLQVTEDSKKYTSSGSKRFKSRNMELQFYGKKDFGEKDSIIYCEMSGSGISEIQTLVDAWRKFANLKKKAHLNNLPYIEAINKIDYVQLNNDYIFYDNGRTTPDHNSFYKY